MSIAANTYPDGGRHLWFIPVVADALRARELLLRHEDHGVLQLQLRGMGELCALQGPRMLLSRGQEGTGQTVKQQN